jgi:uncharacterized membrane protein (TIGR02234 family)
VAEPGPGSGLEPSRRTSADRREYAAALLGGLLGALGVTVGAARPWASATAVVDGLPTLHATVSGAELAPPAWALGLVMLAGFGAVVATRGRVRRALGVLIVAASAAVVVAAAHPREPHAALATALSAKGWTGGGFSTGTQAWRWLVLACALVCAAAGAATASNGHRWAAMGSRYDAPGGAAADAGTAGAADGEAQMWRSIDRGHDPTQSP